MSRFKSSFCSLLDDEDLISTDSYSLAAAPDLEAPNRVAYRSACKET